MLKTSNFNEKMSNMHTHPNGSPTTKKATSLLLACSRIRSRNEKIDSVFLLFLVPMHLLSCSWLALEHE